MLGWSSFLLSLMPTGVRDRLRRRYLSAQVASGEPVREREIELVRKLVAKGDRAVDIGANVGLYTRELSMAVGPSGQVYAFEPVRGNYDILSNVVQRAGLGNVTLFHAALADRSGSRTMVIPSAAGFVGYYQAHFDSDAPERGRRETVTVRTLDELYVTRELSDISFIKCDVEGAELDVLRGGLRLLAATWPTLLIEVSRNTSADCFKILAELGYTAYVYDGALTRIDGYQDGRFSNYFFLHSRSNHLSQLALLG